MRNSKRLLSPRLRLAQIVALAASVALAWACAPPEEGEEGPSSLEQAADPVHELNQRLRNLSLRFENRLEELDRQVSELREEVSEEGSEEASELLADLEEAREVAHQKVNDFGAATGSNWEQLEREAEEALGELERAAEEARMELAPAPEESAS